MIILSGYYPVEVMNWLYEKADIYASLSRGEGFGLTIAEAITREIPVLVPKEGGHVDYICRDSNYLVDGSWDMCFGAPDPYTHSLDEDERKCKVYLLHGDLSESEMEALYNLDSISSMITTTHGEGYGLPLFEFAQTGKPIVAPGWSGHLDFLTNDGKSNFANVNYDISPIQKEAVWDDVLQEGSMWCFPHEGSFKQRVRQVRKGDKWRKKALEQKQYILDTFSREAIESKFVDAVKNQSNTMSSEEKVIIL